MRWKKAVRWYEILVTPRIAVLIAAEATIRPLDTPYSYLRAQMLIDFRNYVWVFNNEFQRYHIASSMDSLVSTSTSNKRRLLWVVRVGFRYCTCINESFKKVALNGFFVVVSEGGQDCAGVPRLQRGYSQLHALVSGARVTQHYCDFPLRLLLLGLNLLLGEFCSIDRQILSFAA